MIIDQVFNNNVVLTVLNGKEAVLWGTGIGYKKKKGDPIDESKIQKKFVLEDEKQSKELVSVFEMISQEEIDLVLEIVDDAVEVMKLKISPSIYAALADHIHYVIERTKQNITLKCPLDREIRYIYPQEYEVCLKYVEWMKNRFDIQLSDCEASSIVLHLLNAERDEQIFERTVLETKLIKDMVDIVRMDYGIEFEEKDFFFRRFILHLQYFVKRVVKEEVLEDEDQTLVEIVKNNYAKAFSCAAKIGKYLEQSQHYKASPNEQMYLAIHIQKITQIQP